MASEILSNILFGKQFQSKQRNEAIVGIIQDYLLPNNIPDTREGYIRGLESEATYRLNACVCSDLADDYGTSLGIMLCTMLLGGDFVKSVAGSGDVYNVTARVELESGKVLFEAVPEGASEGRIEKTAEGYDVVKKIIDACPPSARAELPEDDKLAAVLLCESYWRGKL